MLQLFKESADSDTEDVLSKLRKQEVTGSAFYQAGYKIEFQFFSDLCAISSDDNDRFPTARWNGYRVFGGDGRTLNMPASKQIRGYFGVQSNSSKTSLASMLLVYDVLTGLKLQARLGRMCTGESGLLDDCRLEIPPRPDDLLVLDRIYQEFYAHNLAMNMVALAGIAATEQIEKKSRTRKKKRKLTYKYNWKNAFLQLRKRIVELFCRESVEKILEILVTKVARKLVAVEKGRQFSRKGFGKTG
ncbi:hypothetical protein [Cyclobacterium plantarum]|uniref:Uncharacterized protein n=1 Tax=Cyclobacterium plantarum TaxID=2716263 RepID=A0ABX0HDC3_9BACT|nr:hypothetical protein [Cyclobacterium plantarum]NHE58487.1 hypothetical protein [Cyclobacterium plantarum]